MIFTELSLKGAFRISLERREDDRGFFARSYCENEFAAHGLETNWVQSNISYNRSKGTLRGLHFQRPPHGEVKLVRCVRGAIFDVLVDLRANSPTFGEWTGLTLDDQSRDTVYVPVGFAHGYQTLTDDAELLYVHSTQHVPGAEGGLNHADSALAIAWPLPPQKLSARDSAFPTLSEVEALS